MFLKERIHAKVSLYFYRHSDAADRSRAGGGKSADQRRFQRRLGQIPGRLDDGAVVHRRGRKRPRCGGRRLRRPLHPRVQPQRQRRTLCAEGVRGAGHALSHLLHVPRGGHLRGRNRRDAVREGHLLLFRFPLRHRRPVAGADGLRPHRRGSDGADALRPRGRLRLAEHRQRVVRRHFHGGRDRRARRRGGAELRHGFQEQLQRGKDLRRGGDRRGAQAQYRGLRAADGAVSAGRAGRRAQNSPLT